MPFADAIDLARLPLLQKELAGSRASGGITPDDIRALRSMGGGGHG